MPPHSEVMSGQPLQQGRTRAPAYLRRALCGLMAGMCLACVAGCVSLKHYAADRVGDALAASGSGFSSDDDPELIRAAAPFSLKLMESVLEERPRHTGLLTAAAGSFTQYAYAFVQQDADELEQHDVAGAFALRARARALYLRARDYGLRALETHHPGFAGELTVAAPTPFSLQRGDATAIYWTAVAWAASISLAKDSPDAIAELPRVDRLVRSLEALDPEYDRGSLDTFLISYEMGRPGVRPPVAEAREHFERALRLTGGQRAGPYVAFAENVCVASQDRRQFLATLQQALAIDPSVRREWRLENLIMQRRARWLIGQADQLFLEQ